MADKTNTDIANTDTANTNTQNTDKTELRRRYIKLNRPAKLEDVELDGFDMLIAYQCLPNEVDVNPVMERALLRGMKLAVPALEPGKFALIDRVVCPVQGPEFDISQVSEKALMLVPALAYTKDGARLGRGGGWYDRALARCPQNVLKCGVCRKEAIAQSLPQESYDMRVDRVYSV